MHPLVAVPSFAITRTLKVDSLIAPLASTVIVTLGSIPSVAVYMVLLNLTRTKVLE